MVILKIITKSCENIDFEIKIALNKKTNQGIYKIILKSVFVTICKRAKYLQIIDFDMESIIYKAWFDGICDYDERWAAQVG